MRLAVISCFAAFDGDAVDPSSGTCRIWPLQFESLSLFAQETPPELSYQTCIELPNLYAKGAADHMLETLFWA